MSTIKAQASIIVISLNGAAILPRTMPPLLDEVARSGGGHEVIVVDNGSTDDTLSYLASLGPPVQVVHLDANRGVAGGLNAGLRTATRQFVVTLGNDIQTDPGFLDAILQPFAETSVFAVSGKNLSPEDNVIHAQLRYEFDPSGMFRTIAPRALEPDNASVGEPTVTWCSPWMDAAWRREALAAMGGFEEGFGGGLGWWVDNALCYRAWKQGWSVLFAPQARVHHLCAQTGWVDVPPDDRFLWFKEGLLFFTWVGLTDPAFVERHLAALPDLVDATCPWTAPYLTVVRSLLRAEIGADSIRNAVATLPAPPPLVPDSWQRAFADLVLKLPRVARIREADRLRQRRTDADVLRVVNV